MKPRLASHVEVFHEGLRSNIQTHINGTVLTAVAVKDGKPIYTDAYKSLSIDTVRGLVAARAQCLQEECQILIRWLELTQSEEHGATQERDPFDEACNKAAGATQTIAHPEISDTRRVDFIISTVAAISVRADREAIKVDLADGGSKFGADLRDLLNQAIVERA